MKVVTHTICTTVTSDICKDYIHNFLPEPVTTNDVQARLIFVEQALIKLSLAVLSKS